MTVTVASPVTAPGKGLTVSLWIAQVLVAAVFVMAGFTKLTTPISELAAMMPWAGQYSADFVRTMGAIDLAGGLGILLPALLRILPRLTVVGAAGCAALQVCALVFHLSRGEAMVTPLNLVLLALSLFVLWGRWKKAPILPR